jgi:hypothetical protein
MIERSGRSQDQLRVCSLRLGHEINDDAPWNRMAVLERMSRRPAAKRRRKRATAGSSQSKSRWVEAATSGVTVGRRGLPLIAVSRS